MSKTAKTTRKPQPKKATSTSKPPTGVSSQIAGMRAKTGGCGCGKKK